MPRNLLRILLPGLLTCGLLAVLALRVDLGAIALRVRTADPAFVATASLSMVLVTLAQALRWRFGLSAFGSHESFGALVRIVLVGFSASLFLPTAAGGDLARWGLLSRRGHAAAKAARSVAADRLFGLGTLGVLILLGLPSSWGLLEGAGWRWAAVAVVPLALGALFAVVRPEGLPRRLRARLDVDPVPRPRWLLAAGAVAILSHLLVILTVASLARALGDTTPWSVFTVVVPLVWFASMLPVSLGGLGVRETSFVVLFSAAGMPATTAASVAVLWLALTLALALAGALAAFAESGRPDLLSARRLGGMPWANTWSRR